MPFVDLNALLPGGSASTGDSVPATYFAGIATNFGLVSPWGQWTSFTPSLLQPGAVTKTVVYARWMRIGRLVHAQVNLDVTATGITANAVTVGLPVTAAFSDNFQIVGIGAVLDTSATQIYVGAARLASTTTVDFLAHNSGAQNIGVTPALALASGDIVSYDITYEAATDA